MSMYAEELNPQLKNLHKSNKFKGDKITGRDEHFLVSIVIPVYNGRHIQRCLGAIFNQEVDFSYEVICIDSGSTDKSLDICRSSPVKILQINKSEFNHGLTRNLGIDQSKGKYIILMVQDAIPYKNTWMKTLVKNVEEDEKVAGVYCRQIPQANADILTKRNVNNYLTGRRKRIVSFIQDKARYDSMLPKERYIFCNFDNVCSCIRKAVWEKFPFRKTNFAEDLAWAKQVLEAGYKIIYEPKAVVIHSHRYSFLSEYRRLYINHKKLYELFQFQPLRTWRQMIIFSLGDTLRDTLYILRRKNGVIKVLSSILRIPASSSLKALGRYRGAKDIKTDENTSGNS